MTIEFGQQLLDDLIAVALLDKAEGVIKLPDWQRTLRGEVVAIGPGRMLPLGERAPMECSVGDIVTFSATAGMDSDYGVGKKIRLMKDTDVDTVEVNTWCSDCKSNHSKEFGELFHDRVLA
jgi:co-chaperonin GroES (HSP10)